MHLCSISQLLASIISGELSYGDVLDKTKFKRLLFLNTTTFQNFCTHILKGMPRLLRLDLALHSPTLNHFLY